MKPSKTRPTGPWRGVRMRATSAAPATDPDAEARLITLAFTWDDRAAASLAALAPGRGAVSLQQAAESWIQPIVERARQAELGFDIGARLRQLLLTRRGAPAAPLWRGAITGAPCFCLNLASFHDPSAGFDVPGFAEAAETATWALSLAAPAAARIGVGLADLAGLLAALGVPYDSDAGREIAAGLAALLRAVADATSSDIAETFGAATSAVPDLPAGPQASAIPGLVPVLALFRQRAAALPTRRHRSTTALAAPDLAEALLGVETGGIAPAFSPLDESGRLTRAARAWLAARGMTAETALAEQVAGRSPFPSVPIEAHMAMHATVAPYFESMPAPPARLPAPRPADRQAAAPRRRDLPARHAGATQKASIGGHRLFLRTGEHADGTLGEISVAMPKESPAFRGLLEAFGQAVSLGLQYGVPLDEFVESFVATRFGAAGAVEGDPSVERATSVLDYVFRSLAAHYLGRADLPAAAMGEEEPAAAPPLLPLGLPLLPPGGRPGAEGGGEAPRRRLRLVK